MEWWIIAAIAAGGVLLLVLIILGISKSRKKKKAVKVKAKPIEKKVTEEEIGLNFNEPQPQKQELHDEDFDFEPYRPEEFDGTNGSAEVDEIDEDDEDDDDLDIDDLDEEVRRYREMMMQRQMMEQNRRFDSRYGSRMDRRNMMRRAEQQTEISDNDDFAKFRNEHCYSKYVTDKTLAKKLQGLPDDMKAVIFSNIFDRKEFDNINFGDKKD